MTDERRFLSSLNKEGRTALEQKLHSRQAGKCFICDLPIDLVLHHGQLDIDHIIPVADKGPDEENNYALTHASCNRSKGAADLRVARRMAQFEQLQETAKRDGDRGANLGHILKTYGGATSRLTLKQNSATVEFSLPGVGDNTIYILPPLQGST